MPAPAFAFPPCRSHDLFWRLEEYPAVLQRNPADEVYWLKWDSSFSGDAIVRVARIGTDVLVSRQHRSSRFGKLRSRSARLTMSDWSRLEDAVVAANFWMLDERIMLDIGCDGADWLLAGCRRREYHLVKRWSPDDLLFDVGRLMFDLAGLDEVRL